MWRTFKIVSGQRIAASTLTLGVVLIAACSNSTTSVSGTGSSSGSNTDNNGIHKIKHVVVIMQENRSFDTYFGTYPGVDGIPANYCVPDPRNSTCVKPFHNTADKNIGGPHGQISATMDINGGKMDGFIGQSLGGTKKPCATPNDPNCTVGAGEPDVMGYHDAHEIPNYWSYAQNYVLQDKMFEPNASWSLPEHLFMVSEWSAHCTKPGDPMSCVNALQDPGGKGVDTKNASYGWTDLTYIMHKMNVPWGYYVAEGTEPDCENDATTCSSVSQKVTTPGIWNPLPSFDTVKQDGQLGNIQSITKFYDAAKSGNLPAVSWLAPNGTTSEHPPALISTGQTYVTNVIDSIMKGPDWNSTAIFLSWDDWGGFFDHVTPPTIDQNGYGLRVPGLVISPYAKQGYIDHQTLSFDAYVKFIEDDFLGGQRLDPKTDGRPDPRPTVRENVPQLGDLVNDFDFNQAPRAPMILSPTPPLNGATTTISLTTDDGN